MVPGSHSINVHWTPTFALSDVKFSFVCPLVSRESSWGIYPILTETMLSCVSHLQARTYLIRPVITKLWNKQGWLSSLGLLAIAGTWLSCAWNDLAILEPTPKHFSKHDAEDSVDPYINLKRTFYINQGLHDWTSFILLLLSFSDPDFYIGKKLYCSDLCYI